MIYSRIEKHENEVSKIILDSFLKGELNVETCNAYTDPIGTERFGIYVEDKDRCAENVQLFSVVKYPEWFAELKDLCKYEIEGTYGYLITDGLSETFEQSIFNKALDMCDNIKHEADKPDNLVDYCDWYYDYLKAIAEPFNFKTLKEDKELIVSLIKASLSKGIDCNDILYKHFKNAKGKDLYLYRELINEMK